MGKMKVVVLRDEAVRGESVAMAAGNCRLHTWLWGSRGKG